MSSKEAGTPRISVVMAAYNGAEFLPAAIESILNQTYGDFEFIIIDDGSSDATPEVIRGYEDPRIRAVRNPQNLGLIGSLNRGLDMARGEFVARMDADDEALPRRFEEQVRFFDAHPEVGLCGTAIETFGDRIQRWPLECEPARLRCHLLFDSGVTHPTAMFRRSILEVNSFRYDPAYLHAEDYALWARFSAVTQIANIPLVLLRYRLHAQSISHSQRDKQRATADRIRREQAKKLGINVDDRQLVIQATLLRGAPHTLELDVDETETWMATLLEANRRSRYAEQKVLAAMLYEMWFKLCRAHRRSLKSPALRFLRSPLTHSTAWPNRLADSARLFMLSWTSP